MQPTPAALVVAITFAAVPGPVQGPGHAVVQPETIPWGPMSPRGLATAVVDGDPGKAGPFIMMLKLRDGGWIPPHLHNVDKRLIVLQGELLMGHGDAIDPQATTAIRPGGVAVMPAGEHHYEGGRGETVVALIATGPFTTTMISK